MPVLRTYRKKEGCYILAGIKGRIVTYRLSADGVKRLQENGINDSDKFSWQMLLELIREGEAFTSAPGAEDEDLSGWTQLGLLFEVQENEPSSYDPVPICACGSMEELHLVGLPASETASLLCIQCRTSQREQIDTSIPIYMVNSPAALEKLLSRSNLQPDESVTAYGELLNLNLSVKWESRIRPKQSTMVQSGLFAEPEEQQHSFL